MALVNYASCSDKSEYIRFLKDHSIENSFMRSFP